jgi:hypothetical protein
MKMLNVVEDAIVQEVTIMGTAERIFDALTKPEDHRGQNKKKQPSNHSKSLQSQPPDTCSRRIVVNPDINPMQRPRWKGVVHEKRGLE